MLQNEPPTANNNTIERPFSRWLDTDAEAAFAWVVALPTSEIRDQLTANALASLARTDPQRATTLYGTLPPAAQASSAAPLAGQWSRDNPAAAIAWAARLPAGEGRRDAVSNVISNWAEMDPVAAAGWLGTMPHGEDRDFAIQSFSSQAIDVDPEAALTWAASMADQTLRGAQIRSLVEDWQRSNPIAARQWVERSNALSSALRNQLLQPR
jgi:hypothetical protein